MAKIRGSFGKSWNSHNISELRAWIFINSICTESYIFPLEHVYKIYVQMQTRMYKFEAFHARVSLLTKFSINSALTALEEQRAYIKIRTLLGATLTDIKADLDTVYGSQAASYITITRWFLRFKQGRESVEDDPCSGRLLSAFSEDTVTAVKCLLDEDARYTVDEISESLSNNSSAVFMILKQRLGLRKICARWVPHLLSQVEKDRRVEIASELLQIYDGCDDKRLCEIVTGDET